MWFVSMILLVWNGSAGAGSPRMPHLHIWTLSWDNWDLIPLDLMDASQTSSHGDHRIPNSNKPQ